MDIPLLESLRGAYPIHRFAVDGSHLFSGNFPAPCHARAGLVAFGVMGNTHRTWTLLGGILVAVLVLLAQWILGW